MQLRMWTYDLAREQAPTLDHLRRFMDVTREGGFTAIGLYLEHRFAYPSTPWSQGKSCLTPEMVCVLEAEYPDIQIIPLINLLGHFEGMLYTEEGKAFREERFSGMQACPSCPAFVELCERIIDDTLASFKSEVVHIGGDETAQLGRCPACASRVAASTGDGKAELYGEHFGRLAARVVDKGRRAAVWGDMFVEHPSALEALPKNTLIFDWQYFKSPLESSRGFVERGFEVVCCPSIQTYNAVWCHLPQSEQNVRDAVSAAHQLGAFGVCVTTWEMGLFGSYETLLPAIRASGKLIREDFRVQERSEAWDTDVVISIDSNKQFDPDELIYPHGSNIWLADKFVQIAATLEDGKLAFVEHSKQVEIQERIGALTVHGAFVSNLQWQSVLARLMLYADLDLLKKRDFQEGLIEGSLDGKPFQLSVVLNPDSETLLLIRKSDVTEQTELDYASLTDAPAFLAEYARESTEYLAWARLMGIELQKLGGVFGYSHTRSSLKCRLLLYSNPFLAWLYHAEELAGEAGEKAMWLAAESSFVAPNVSARGVSQFLLKAVEFVRLAENARLAYSAGQPGVATSALAPGRQIFDAMESVAKATQLNIGGSLADAERCKAGREHIERVIRRIKEFGDGHLGYLPAFEVITHQKFVPHDQACWWLINRWANE